MANKDDNRLRDLYGGISTSVGVGEALEGISTVGTASERGSRGSGGGNKPPEYAGTYDEQLQDLYDQIQGRGPFSYDVDADPLYENYKDQYIQGGKRSMRDTMGQAAALTGGYGSTYSQQAGQQSYDAYMQQLTDKIPELYNMAYGMYRDKGDELLRQYDMMSGLRDTEYSRWRDAMTDYNYEREFAAQQEQQEYARQQQAYANLIALIQSTGYKPTDRELQAAGMTRRQAEKLLEAWKKANKPASSGGGGGGGRGGGRRSSKPQNDGKTGRGGSSSPDSSSSGKEDRDAAARAALAERDRQQEAQRAREEAIRRAQEAARRRGGGSTR